MIEVRRARSDEARACHELIASLGYDAIAPDVFDATFAEVASDARAAVLVAVTAPAGQVVGLVTMSFRVQYRLAGVLATIDELVVDEAARGEGIGGALLDAARAEARGRGAKRTELHTNRRRESYARGFYVKRGFREAEAAVMREGS